MSRHKNKPNKITEAQQRGQGKRRSSDGREQTGLVNEEIFKRVFRPVLDCFTFAFYLLLSRPVYLFCARFYAYGLMILEWLIGSDRVAIEDGDESSSAALQRAFPRTGCNDIDILPQSSPISCDRIAPGAGLLVALGGLKMNRPARACVCVCVWVATGSRSTGDRSDRPV